MESASSKSLLFFASNLDARRLSMTGIDSAGMGVESRDVSRE
jgi:hypothetical protein